MINADASKRVSASLCPPRYTPPRCASSPRIGGIEQYTLYCAMSAPAGRPRTGAPRGPGPAGAPGIYLLVRYGDERLAIELKVWRDGAGDPRSEGLVQLDRYLTGLGLERGWLVIFDRRSGLPRLAERTATEAAVSPGGRAVTVVRA